MFKNKAGFFIKPYRKEMKKLFFALALFMTGAGAYSQSAKDTLPVIKFDKVEHDFGKIKEGTLATYSFVFYNTGTTPLILNHVQASCGCTTPEWSKEPIMPGGKGLIKAAYNSYGRPGEFQKYITVKSNGGSDVTLTIKGNALPNIPPAVSPVRNPQAE